MKLPHHDVTVIVPTKEEAPTVEGVVKGAKKFASRVIVIDGHSLDETRELAARAGAEVMLDDRRGKGAAMRLALAQVKTKFTVFIDADASHDPEDIPKLLAPLMRDEADHVGASRLIGGSSELHGGFDEFLRLAGSSFITACIGHKFGIKLSDSQNGFRAARTEILNKLNLCEDSTTIEQEMIIKTLRKGYRLVEVPSHEHARRFGQSKINLSEVWFDYGWSLVRHLYLGDFFD